MNFADIPAAFVYAVITGAIYVLVSIGYVVVYRASRVFNFLHPNFMLAGALLLTTIAGGSHSPAKFLLAAAASAIGLAAFGALIYFGVMRQVVALPQWVQMIVTMGLGLAALNVIQLFWGSTTRYVSLPFKVHVYRLPGRIFISTTDIAVVVTCLFLGVVLYWVLVRTRLGTRLKATAESPGLASYCGIRLSLWVAVAWSIAAAAAVVGGIAYSLRVPLDPSLSEVGLLAFPAAMIGGMSSIEGAFVGAGILALIQQLTIVLWSADAATPVSFAAVLLILLVRPQGLLGGREVRRV
jgi:branched-chain amino acid transport system permease protein